MEVTKNLCSFRVSSRVSNQGRDSEKPRARESETHRDSSEREREREREREIQTPREIGTRSVCGMATVLPLNAQLTAFQVFLPVQVRVFNRVPL